MAVRVSRLVAMAAALHAVASMAAAQGYRARVDTRWQTAAYRGVTLDSIPVGDTVSSSGGGPMSPDGFAVLCHSGAAYCTFFRPGPEHRGGPMTAMVDLSVWGFGVTGLSVRMSGRAATDVGSADAWPGTDPAVQLLEGYAEYAIPRATARLGRQIIPSRLGMTGFDGGSLRWRAERRVELQAYGGWGLARGVALPVTSPALNPLDDFQPTQRQLLAGASAGWTSTAVDARVEYQREVDPQAHKFVSERVGFDAAVSPMPNVRLSGGADYDIAAGWWGSAEAALTYLTQKMRGSVGVKRYRPHFDLWTIWGAFSPVPYNSVQASVAVAAMTRLEVRGRYERYRYEEAATETPLFATKRDGWRGELGATVTPLAHWTVDAGYQREYGPGASVSGTAATVTYEPTRRVRAILLASAADRPLEFRFNDAVVRVYGLDAQYMASERLRVSATVQRYQEDHRRPDAGAFDWRQFRAGVRFSFAFGSADEVAGLTLPPAIRMLPGDRSAR